jgi:hypothetical protein
VNEKSEYNSDCCAWCESTRILGQIVSGIADNVVRINMLEQGDALTSDRAVTILHTTETSQLQAANLQEDHTINAIPKSAYQAKKAVSFDSSTNQTKRKKTDSADSVEKTQNTSEKIVQRGGRNIGNAERRTTSTMFASHRRKKWAPYSKNKMSPSQWLSK